jgi:hypothetical protein
MIQMVDLLDPPFNLALDDDIESKVQAHNARGWSLESLVGSGVQVESTPAAMSSPSSGTSTSTT